MKKHHVIVGLSLLCLLVLVTYFYFRSSSSQPVNEKNQSAGSALPAIPHKTQASNDNPDIANSKKQEINLSEADKKVLHQWLLENGYGGTVRRNYEAYSPEALATMAKNGDVHAMAVLANSALHKKGLNTALGMYSVAAIHGSTSVFVALGEAEELFAFQPETDTRKRESAAVSILSWFKVASLRGDQWPELSMFNSFVKRQKIELTDDLQNRINQLAQVRYDSLQKARYERGLGDFDNSVPPAISKFFEQQRLGKTQ